MNIVIHKNKDSKSLYYQISLRFTLLLSLLFYIQTTQANGYQITDNLWFKSIIHTVEKPIDAIWKNGGSATMPSGDKVIWGHLYANPSDVSWGNENNPDQFVKIWFDKDGRIDVNFFHVSVPDIEVLSAMKDVDETPNHRSTMYNRYVRHYYQDNTSGADFPSTMESRSFPVGDSTPSSFDIINDLKIGAFIEVEEKDLISAVWRFGGSGTSERGDQVAWGYFYADPKDVDWGNPDNPEVFVKIWFDVSGRVDVNFFHVSVPNIKVFSGFSNYQKEGLTTLDTRYTRHEYYPNNGNTPPVASPISLQANPHTLYQEISLIGNDVDGDTLDYELLAPTSGIGYSLAYIPSRTPKLYVTLKNDFSGTIILPYRVTDGQYFSEPADVRLEVGEKPNQRELGLQDIDLYEYSNLENSVFSGDLFGAPGAGPTLPRNVDLSNNFPIPGNQGQQGSCVGWATAYALKSYQERMEEGWSLNAREHLFSPAFIYNQINGGRNNGSSIKKALELIIDKGAATLATMPYNQYDYTTQPNPTSFQEAANFKAQSLKRADSTLTIKKSLANRQPVVVGISVYNSLMQLKGSNAVYNSADGELQGGHAVTIVGYDDDKFGGAFKIINSWGTDWGDEGYFWLPYQFANSVHPGYNGRPQKVLKYAYVLKDKDNTGIPTPIPDTEPEEGDLPNLQVESWSANYNPRPNGEGKLQYSIKNTGQGIAYSGADVNLMLSKDAKMSSNDIYVVYETIPFDLKIGASVYRDENNSISFKFPNNINSGIYYMAVWVDDRNVIKESNEDDNFSLGNKKVDIHDDLPDLVVETWRARWNTGSGNGTLEYKIRNEGASATTVTNWDINLVLSEDEIIGNNNEWYLFYEHGNHILNPNQIVYRDENNPASFNLYKTQEGNNVPTGTYYMALWVDDRNKEQESDETNNYSLGGNRVPISATRSLSKSLDSSRSSVISEAYNGKRLPKQLNWRKVEIIDTPEGGHRIKSLSSEIEKPLFNKQIHSADQIVFPTTNSIAMPIKEDNNVQDNK